MVLPSPILARKDFGSNWGLRLAAIAGDLSPGASHLVYSKCLEHPDSAAGSTAAAGMESLLPHNNFSSSSIALTELMSARPRLTRGARLFCSDTKARLPEPMWVKWRVGV